MASQDFGRLLPCCRNSFTIRDFVQQSIDIGGLCDFEELVGSIVLQPPDGCCRIEECNPLKSAEFNYPVFVEALCSRQNKVIAVVIKQKSADPPEIVDKIRVKEIDAPAFFLRRKASKEQHPCSRGQEWLERMLFYFSHLELLYPLSNVSDHVFRHGLFYLGVFGPKAGLAMLEQVVEAGV